MLLQPALALATCLAPAIALYQDEAYHIDFHYALLGLPEHDATFFQQPYAGSRASLLYSLSQNQTIGAVNPKDGALVWRHHFPSAPRGKGHLRSGAEQDTVISAVGDHITAWTASEGRLVWETAFEGATVADLEILEQQDGRTANEAKDVIVLLADATNGVRRLDGKTGQVKWSFDDTSGDTPFQVSTSPTTIYYISLHASMLGGSKLRVTSLSPITGQKLDQYTLNSDTEASATDHILFAGANTAAPLIAWTDKADQAVHINIIGSKSTVTFSTPPEAVVDEILLHAPNHVNSRPHFLVEYKTATGHLADVYHVNLQKNAVSKAYSLPEVRGKGTFTTSTSDANVYFTRITEDEVTVFGSASNSVLGRWRVKSSRALAGAYPVHGHSEVVIKAESASAVRSAVFYSNGQWALLRNDEVAWTRPEFLSKTTSAVWACLPEKEALAHALAEEGHRNLVSAYLHRVQRHVQDLKYFPAWVQEIPTRLMSSILGKARETTVDAIQQDTFGFHKLVIVATETGRLAALDVGSRGQIMWNVDVTEFAPNAILQHPSLQAHSGYVEVNYAGLERSLFVNATTGSLIAPNTVTPRTALVSAEQSLIVFELVEGTLRGFMGNQPGSEPIWSFAPAVGERIVGYTARPIQDPVASIGRVLGDRRVLYKYLNPNLVVVTAVTERTASIYLLDSASGQLLHTMSHNHVDTSRTIPVTISENWFAYSFSIDGTSSSSPSRGYQLVVSDLYESPLPDDRGPLGATENSSTVQPSSTAGDATKPHVLSQSYQVLEEISHMTVTQTTQGITSRELLITVPSTHSIVGIPRSVLDPRRPVGRDPTAQEQAEGLARYSPVISLDPKWHLNHKYELIGIREVMASKSGIESTSLVFAYGLDIFATRVAPSFTFDMLGKGFNKISMLLTVVGLFVGVLFVAPLVRRKQINTLWTI